MVGVVEQCTTFEFFGKLCKHTYNLFSGYRQIDNNNATEKRRYIDDWLCQSCYIASQFFRLVKAVHIVTNSSATGSKLIEAHF